MLIFVGIIWAIWLIDWLFNLQLDSLGIVPRRLSGLAGVLFSPFLHAGFGHLLSNTVPLIVLLVLLMATKTDPWIHIAELIVLSGGLLWLFGRKGSQDVPVVHVGASGLIYALIAYLIVAGFKEKRVVSIAVALLVGFLYGGSLLSGILPTQKSVSWDGHLAGLVAGVILAIAFANSTSADTKELS